jgi:hypothetical protein
MIILLRWWNCLVECQVRWRLEARERDVFSLKLDFCGAFEDWTIGHSKKYSLRNISLRMLKLKPLLISWFRCWGGTRTSVQVLRKC